MEKAGNQGMNPDEMVRVIEAHGGDGHRGRLRSFVWHNKEAGEFVPLPTGRYMLKKFAKTEGSGTSAPDPSV
jgi:hypothetical protein